MKKYMAALMTGAIALSLMVGCSASGDPKGANPTSGVQKQQDSVPSNAIPTDSPTDSKSPADSTQSPAGTDSKQSSKGATTGSNSSSTHLKSPSDGATSKTQGTTNKK